ncbi:di-trans,poly-cis-decaprenylcistransferase [Candidatus Woesearchaeota archaeon]|nr:di-trans,poly-cis-decaprenylcistransferase [Candidatus Woesearchaeota archaeon]
MKIPKHVGFIIDGNRRFAKRLMKSPQKGHEWGYEKVKKLIDWCKEFNIQEFTLYTFSLENFDRPKAEFDYLMKLFKKAFIELQTEKDKIKDLRVKFIGRLHLFPEDVKKEMYNLMEKTKNNEPFKLNFAMAYSGRAEIIDAVKKVAEAVKSGNLSIEDIDEKVLQEQLYMDSDPDLIIRTSESRLSGFLLWQASYSELIFLPNILWPEFTKENLVECLEKYSNIERRFGK